MTGGIAAYKACELARLLVRAGHDVTPILTPEAESFVAAKTFEALARREAPRELYPHLIEADLLRGRAALGEHAGQARARARRQRAHRRPRSRFEGPVVAAPAMNPRMWAQPGDAGERASCSRPAASSWSGPTRASTAEGEIGVGRMSRAGGDLRARRRELERRRAARAAGGCS